MSHNFSEFFLGTLYRSERDSAGVFVLVNIILCIILAASYFYSPYISINYQITINLFFMILTMIGILKIDLIMRKNNLFKIK